MAFRIPTHAKEWFKHIDKDSREKGFSTDFDILYFCFIAGITQKRKADLNAEDTNELIDYFPDKFQRRGKLIVGLFLNQELEALGVTMNEKKVVHSEIARLVDYESQSSLSEVGQREFNKYVYGGFNVLLDWFDDSPRTLETFLRTFARKVDGALVT